EFAKDVIALVNTKSSGARFMVIGFDDKSRAFHLSVQPGVGPDRLQDILNERVEPFPNVTYHTVSWESGTVGIIEIEREPHKLPYKAKKDMVAKSGPIAASDVFVRHGTHNVMLALDAPELLDLIAEGNRARGQN